jgi:hypothetical protein
MKRFEVTTIDKEYELRKASVPIKGHMRRGKWVNQYIQQRITRGDVSNITERLEKEGGFSWRPWGKEVPDSGFMLGLKGHGQILEEGTKVSNIRSWLMGQREFVKAHPDRYYGGWIHPETRKVYLDVSLNLQDKMRALREAKKTGEYSIWDVSNKEELKA